MKILINSIIAKQGGGAFQIAYNFTIRTLEDSHEDIEWYYIVSQDLDKCIGLHFANKKGPHYFVFPTQPDFMHSYFHVKKELDCLIEKIQPDVIFTTSSPCYFQFKCKEVMRFANAWITNPNKYAWKSMPLLSKVRMVLYCYIQRRLIKQGKYFVTQTETVKLGLQRLTKLPSSHIMVIQNVLPAAIRIIDNTYIGGENWCDIACVADYMPHKNLSIIKQVLMELKEKYGIINARFHLTVNQDETFWQNMQLWLNKNGFVQNVINHGRLSQTDLSYVYRQCKLCFLPSLLETFSASTIEAMYFNLATIAADLPYNHEVFHKSCLYFDPMSASSAAEKIASLVGNKSEVRQMQNAMKEILPQYFDYDNYFDKTVDFLKCVINDL